jgi:hypothetical protein
MILTKENTEHRRKKETKKKEVSWKHRRVFNQYQQGMIYSVVDG